MTTRGIAIVRGLEVIKRVKELRCYHPMYQLYRNKLLDYICLPDRHNDPPWSDIQLQMHRRLCIVSGNDPDAFVDELLLQGSDDYLYAIGVRLANCNMSTVLHYENIFMAIRDNNRYMLETLYAEVVQASAEYDPTVLHVDDMDDVTLWTVLSGNPPDDDIHLLQGVMTNEIYGTATVKREHQLR